ncbi:MAG: hypothetical protein EBX40_01680, partial [Gammaproteobacteria bacterium]|nr:hypothetical protein [Gammaproteobacteria bacterium]
MKIRLLSLMLFFIMTLSAQAAMVIVNVQGVSKDLTGMIRNNLSLISESAHGLPTDSRIEILYQQGQSEIQNTLKPYGYYKADISSSLQHTQKGDWLAIYRIMPGPRILITKTDIQIKGDSSNSALFNAMIQKNRIEVGKPLIHDNYTALKDDLLNKALSLGYFEAHYTASQIQIELKKNTAAVILHLQLGPRYTFGVIHFDQSAYAFDEAFLRRYLPFMTGAPFEASKVSDLQNALNNSNYFDNVIVNTRNNSENGTTDVDVKLHAKPAQEYTFGIGYGTETGPRALIGWKYRHTTSTGQYFTSQLQISSVYQDITASYVFQGANPVT